MKETYSMKEVIFMYLKAGIKKEAWDTFRTVETAPTDEFRKEYKRIISIMKKITRIFTDSEECAKVIEGENFSVMGKDVGALIELFYRYDTDPIWREIEKLLPLYDSDEENSEESKKHRGTERSTAVKKVGKLKKGPKRDIEDFINEIEDVLKISFEDYRDKYTNERKKTYKGCTYDVDIMCHEIYETADILERIFQDRVAGIADLLDNASGRNLLVRKGTWNIIE